MPDDDFLENRLTVGRLYDSLFSSDDVMKSFKYDAIYVENFKKKKRYREGRKS